MQCPSEAECLALDAQCGDLASPVSRRTIRELRAMPVEDQIEFTANCIIFDCDHLVRCALAAGVSADSRGQGMPLLCVAAEYGSFRPLQTLLAGGADPNALDFMGSTAVMIAIGYKQHEICRALLDFSNLSLACKGGTTALHDCIIMDSQVCFELVLERVIDVDVRTEPGVDEHEVPLGISFGRTALFVACEFGQHDMVKALLNRGASRTAADSNGCSPVCGSPERPPKLPEPHSW